jgi:hypothetical protein
MLKHARLGLLALPLGLILAAPSAQADMKLQKAAKKAGFEVKNCLYCHGEKMPKKGKSTYNDRGQFLIDQKEEKQAEEIDVNWLKDYEEKAEESE